MKFMKKIKIVFGVLLLLVVSIFFYGCNKEENYATFILKNGDEVVTLKVDLSLKEFKGKEEVYVIDVLDSKKYQKDLNSEYTDGENPFLTKIGTLVQDADNGAYIMIYTSDKTSAFEEYTISYDNTTYYSAKEGIKTLAVKNGETYIFNLEVYTF